MLYRNCRRAGPRTDLYGIWPRAANRSLIRLGWYGHVLRSTARQSTIPVSPPSRVLCSTGVAASPHTVPISTEYGRLSQIGLELYGPILRSTARHSMILVCPPSHVLCGIRVSVSASESMSSLCIRMVPPLSYSLFFFLSCNPLFIPQIYSISFRVHDAHHALQSLLIPGLRSFIPGVTLSRHCSPGVACSRHYTPSKARSQYCAPSKACSQYCSCSVACCQHYSTGAARFRHYSTGAARPGTAHPRHRSPGAPHPKNPVDDNRDGGAVMGIS